MTLVMAAVSVIALLGMSGMAHAAVSLDRVVYPVPFAADTIETANDGEYLLQGDLVVHITVYDTGFDVSAGEDTLPVDLLNMRVIRGSLSSEIDLGGVNMTEVAPDAGVFEISVPVAYDDGPSSQIMQGDILQVEYTDPSDEYGEKNTTTDSATFDLRNAILQSDSSSYAIGADMILTLIEPDFDLDSDSAETYTLNLIKWDSHPTIIGMGGDPAFDPEPIGLRETGDSTGIFQSIIKIPTAVNGTSLLGYEQVRLEYVDHGPSGSDYVGDEKEDVRITVSINPNVRGLFASQPLGTVVLDRTIYPVPFSGASFLDARGNQLPQGDLTAYVRVNDPGFDISPAEENTIPTDLLNITLVRGSESVDIEPSSTNLTEITPSAGVFELAVVVAYDDGPSNSILRGDTLQVVYGNSTDSATFDLHSGTLRSDKSTYQIGTDMILTLIEPDLNLDSDGAETYTLDLIEWDSDAATVTIGSDLAFDPEPAGLRETGDSTGIFQSIIEIPAELDGDHLEHGEEIELEYVDHGPPGSDFVGHETEDINLTVFASNFSAIIELDQKVYTWTDKVYITIIAPNHNFDPTLIDEIGESDLDPIKIATRSDKIDNYKLVETGPDTGIFTGEITLIGFDHNADGDVATGTETAGYDNPQGLESEDNSGPTNGYIAADDDDGITVSFEFLEDETVIGSALIRWNIGEIRWLEASYPASGTGIVHVIDPDMNWNPESADNFEVDVWSDTDTGGTSLTVTETGPETGIFEGVVSFTTTEPSSGHSLHVSAGDIVTVRYGDNTLPEPHNTSDEIFLDATALIDGAAPPSEGASIAQIRLDQDAYTWTDEVLVTVEAPSHNLDPTSVDEIGRFDDNLVRISTREGHIDNYVLVETGADTGVFTGRVTLIGFDHNADGDTTTGTETSGYDNPQRETEGGGPTGGHIKSGHSDGISVSFRVSEDETVTESAPIRWNIGKVQWLETAYSASHIGMVRVIDPDMNWNSDMIDNFEVDVWSDEDSGGIDLTVIETGLATGIFEGAVFFTTTSESSGHRLRVAEGNTITAEYEDNTLPTPYNPTDELGITSTTLIDYAIPNVQYPLETCLEVNGIPSIVSTEYYCRYITTYAHTHIPFATQPPNTISFDKTFYPVPFSGASFADANGKYLPQGDLTVYIRVYDPDFNISPTKADTIPTALLNAKVTRGSESVDVDLGSADMVEIAPDAGVFEISVTVAYNDGPNNIIRQGDILKVEYTDRIGTSEYENVLTDSATFGLRNGILLSDALSYSIGSDMILTLIDPDFDLNSDVAETYTLDLIEWDSDAATVAMGSDPAFAPIPIGLHETGDSTGIFQSIITIPQMLDGNRLVWGDEVELEYVDYGPSDSYHVGDETEDINHDVLITPDGQTPFATQSPGTVALDRVVYPVPFSGASFVDANGKYLPQGDLTVYIRVYDPDFNISPTKADTIPTALLNAKVTRGSESVDVDLGSADMVEIAPDAGVFEISVTVAYDNGPNGTIRQGDTLRVEYTDPTVASSEPNVAIVLATFDLHSGVLRSDSGYPYAADAKIILTLIDPDLNLDAGGAETHTLDLIELHTRSTTVALGSDPVFDPEPVELLESGDSTGIFQSVIKIPTIRNGGPLERDEEINFRYVDHGPTGADYVGVLTEIINITDIIHSTGAAIDLDQKIYSWTDKVYITIIAHDHNFDPTRIDEIGESNLDPIKIATRNDKIDNYKLAETGPDTGIFTGEITLIGFDHNADGDVTTGTAGAGYDNPQGLESEYGSGPTNGYIAADDDDGIIVSFEFSEDQTIIGSALIRWNIGTIEWLGAPHSILDTGVIRVTDPDMNLNPDITDVFKVQVQSDADTKSINVNVTETDVSTGVFEAVVHFVATESSGHRLRVSENSTVTATYVDHTLPDPYSIADSLSVEATTTISTITPSHMSTFGSQGDGVDQFTEPAYTASNSTHLFVTQDDRHYVQIFDADGTFAGKIGHETGGAGDGYFDHPTGLTHNGTHLLVSDKNNGRVQIFDDTGRFAGKFETHAGAAPYHIETIPTRIFVVMQSTSQIQLFDASGGHIRTFGGAGSGDGQFSQISGTTTNSTHLFVLDSLRHIVQIFDAQGVFVDKFGSKGSGDGQFEIPTDIEHHNPLFVSDAGRGDVQMFDTAGQFIAKFGSKGSGDGQFASPATIATTRTQLFVLDDERDIVQSFSLFEAVADTVLPANTVPFTTTESARICR